MQADDTAPASVIEGYFQRAQAKPARRLQLTLLLLLLLILSAALILPSPLLLAAAISVGLLASLALRRKGRASKIKVRLAGSDLRVDGDDYHIRLAAPFRFKTGLERNMASEKQEETCFVRMVIDVHGKPLVFEEQVLAGYFPPQLDEIAGKSSALGIAELTSLTPYPGALWAIIERMESLSEAGAAAEPEDDVASLYRLGRQQMADEEFDEAVKTFSALIRQQPYSVAAYYNRGSARYHARRELDKAINDLTTALRLDPQDYKAYRMRGLARAQLGDWVGLRDDSSLALQYRPTSAELHNLRGTACYRLQDYAAALASFEAAVRLDGSRPESYYNRGLARRRQGELAGAISDFNHALRLNPAFAEARRNLLAAREQLRREETKSPS
ncbi:MAG: tetratricopeptide repeat protein [Chloroflexi bacterium]|nr:tetratricopeptide repeat protein [Chloroflexota bacterium]